MKKNTYKLYNKYIDDESKFISLMIERVNYNINKNLPPDISAEVDFIYTESKQQMLEYVFKKNKSDHECMVVYSPDFQNVIDTMGSPNDIVYIINEAEKLKNDDIMSDILYLNNLSRKK